MYFSRDLSQNRKGINIQITDKEDGDLPVNCLFCTKKAEFWVKTSDTLPLVQLRICSTPECCSKAFSYALWVGYRIPLEGGVVLPKTCSALTSA